MATYVELHDLKDNSDLQDQVRVAVVVAADGIRSDVAPPANQVARLAWASKVMTDPALEAKRMVWAVLAANKDATVGQITSASDASVQAAVDTAVDLFADNP